MERLEYVELDELYWFIGHKNKTQTRKNIYIMTMVSQQPRRIIGVEIAQGKSACRIQRMVGNAPEAKRYLLMDIMNI